MLPAHNQKKLVLSKIVIALFMIVLYINAKIN